MFRVILQVLNPPLSADYHQVQHLRDIAQKGVHHPDLALFGMRPETTKQFQSGYLNPLEISFAEFIQEIKEPDKFSFPMIEAVNEEYAKRKAAEERAKAAEAERDRALNAMAPIAEVLGRAIARIEGVEMAMSVRADALQQQDANTQRMLDTVRGELAALRGAYDEIGLAPSLSPRSKS